MKAVVVGLFSLAMVGLTGCGPSEPAAPDAPVKDEMTLRREWLFGPRGGAPDIIWRPSGLGIRLLAAGAGTAPGFADRVRVHYSGSLKDGRVFIDTRAGGKPADLAMKTLIVGWADGMAELKPGGRAEFFIPPSQGYGNAGIGDVPPGSGLIFDVELLEVNPTPAKP